MKVLIFHNYNSPYRNKLFNYLSKKVDLTVCFLQTKESENRNWVIKDKTTYKSINIKSKRIYKFFINEKDEIDKILSKKWDKIIIPMNIPNINTISYIIKNTDVKKRDIFLWVEEHTFLNKKIKLRSKLAAEYFTRKYIKKIQNILIFNKKGYFDLKNKYPNKNIFYVPQSVNYENEIKKEEKKNKNNKTIIFGYLGQFNKRKNILNFVKIFKKIDKEGFKLLIAGSGPLRKDLEETIKNRKDIEILGYIEDKKIFFNKIDYLVLPSLYDPWGLVVNEAMMYGVPVITSYNCNSSEMVQNEINGYIINFNVKEINDLLEILKYNNKYLKMQEYCLLKAKEYTIEKSGDSIYGALKYVEK